MLSDGLSEDVTHTCQYEFHLRNKCYPMKLCKIVKYLPYISTILASPLCLCFIRDFIETTSYYLRITQDCFDIYKISILTMTQFPYL
jgi:hypothetical protein